MAIIKIPYKPRNWSKALHNACTRWIILILHRRAGKTTSAINHLQRDALNNPGTRYAYVAPTFKQAKRIVWGMAKFYSNMVPGVKYNEAELLIIYPNGSEIVLLGSDNPDSLRGIALWGAFLDEYPLQSPVVFTQIISKCLADHQGYCIFGGTPKGKGSFFKLYQVAGKNPEEYTLIFKTIDESLKEEAGETIDNLRQSLEDDKKLVRDGIMTEDEFQQEWYNSFEAAIKGAVYLKELARARKDNRICGGLFDPTLPVYTVWDIGVSKSDAMAIGFFQKVGKEPRLIDYYENTGLGLPHYLSYLQVRAKERHYVYGKHFAPHDIKQKEFTTGKTRLETARRMGVDFEVVSSISLDDGIDLARAFFVRLWVDKLYCEVFLDLIGQYKYVFDEKRGMNTRAPAHDFTSHSADMLRYAAIIEDEMTNDEPVAPPQTQHSDPDDEYVGHENFEIEHRDGMGKHPLMRGVNIGSLGHKK